MIRPMCRCSPACPGWRVAIVSAVPVVRRCVPCWQGEPLRPTWVYYQRQPECIAAIVAAWNERIPDGYLLHPVDDTRPRTTPLA